MPVTIGNNISALQVIRQLGRTTQGLSETREKLSSGQRINHASDDAAGLAISESLGANSRVYGQAIRNVNDGISYLNIAQGAVETLKSIVTRVEELSQQAANGTYSLPQRDALNKEAQALTSEFNRVLDSTTFNGRAVLSRTDGTLSLQSGYGTDGVISSTLLTSRATTIDQLTVQSRTDTGSVLTSGSMSGLSVDGRYVGFYSNDSGVVSGVAGSTFHLYLRDRATGTTSELDVSSSGTAGNQNASQKISFSSDSRYIAFASGASNLVSGDSGSSNDIFVRDLVTGNVVAVSQNTSGSVGTGTADNPGISSDGRYVVFESSSTSLVSGDTNAAVDIFVRDTLAGTTTRVNVDSSGSEANQLSGLAQITPDGRYVVFASAASNLVSGDTNAITDVFLRDISAGTTTRLSVSSAGAEGNNLSSSPQISGDGRYVVFNSIASNLVTGDTNGTGDVFLRDTQNGTTTLISQATDGTQSNGVSLNQQISGDGRFVVFQSTASNLVSGDTNGVTDIFVRDTLLRTTTRVSVGSNGQEGSAASTVPRISSDGRYISFQTSAPELVGSGTNVVTVVNPALTQSVTTRLMWLDLRSQAGARAGLDWAKQYLDELNQLGGQLGAQESRLQIELSTVQTTKTNYDAARSRIVDADIGQASAELVRSQILQQAGAAILAQAVASPRLALQLLSG